MRSSTETAVDPEAALPGRILSLWRTFRIGARADRGCSHCRWASPC